MKWKRKKGGAIVVRLAFLGSTMVPKVPGSADTIYVDADASGLLGTVSKMCGGHQR